MQSWEVINKVRKMSVNSAKKILAINGSPRPKGNTFQLIEMVFTAIKEEDNTVETELIQLAGKTINTCLSCYKCVKNRDNRCIQNDDLNQIYAKMVEADAIIFGAPVYFGDAPGKMRSFIERIGMVAMFNNRAFKRKINGDYKTSSSQNRCYPNLTILPCVSPTRQSDIHRIRRKNYL